MLGKITPEHLPRPAMDRRRFIQVIGLSGAGFMIGCSRQSDEPAAPAASAAAGDTAEPVTSTEFGPFIRVGSDNRVTVMIKHLDKGQGVTTGLPTIVAEELDADWAQMGFEFAPADASRYNNLFFGPYQGTGGSTSIANSWTQLREAAAAARHMLIEAAAARWQVAAGEIEVKSGRLSHGDRSASFGELAEAAADIAPPAEPVLKDPAGFTLIGTHLPRLDSPGKTDGSETFTIDVTRPGMLTAVVAHPPKFGAQATGFDAAAALDVPGVTDVVEIARGVAVVADSFWAAKKGRDALTVTWDESGAVDYDSEQLYRDFAERMASDPGLVARNDGNAGAALEAAGEVIRREYRVPFLAHATMEPMDCVVELSSDACEIWTGAQLQTVDQYTAATIAGLTPEQVTINTCFAGGSFGRRATPDSDYIAEAVMIAKAIDGRAPVKLIWTREDDMRAGFYRPMSAHVLEAALDADGKPVAWRHQTAVQSILAGTPFEGMVQDGIDGASVEGSRGLPYSIPNVEVRVNTIELGVPVLWWRSVGHTQNGFVTEAFIDELAALGGQDPYALRRELLADHPRHLAVLDLAAEKAGWGEDLGPGRGRGIAVHESFGSFVAEVVDVSVAEDGSFSVDRVVCAVDCGIAINPDVIKAQMEGGIGYALSAALREEVTLASGAVSQANFDSYRPLRIDEMPDIEVHIVVSGEAPTGVGEPGTPPLAPALVAALADATGKRVYRMPIGNQLRSETG